MHCESNFHTRQAIHMVLFKVRSTAPDRSGGLSCRNLAARHINWPRTRATGPTMNAACSPQLIKLRKLSKPQTLPAGPTPPSIARLPCTKTTDGIFRASWSKVSLASMPSWLTPRALPRARDPAASAPVGCRGSSEARSCNRAAKPLCTE